MNNATTEFEHQRAAGRKLSLQEGAGDIRTSKTSFTPNKQSFKKEAKPKGHEAFLKALETSGAEICVEFLDSIPGDPVFLIGIVKHSDAYTISLDTCGGYTEVIFKHAIRKFACTTRKEGE